jgi:hypothetical protein
MVLPEQCAMFRRVRNDNKGSMASPDSIVAVANSTSMFAVLPYKQNLHAYKKGDYQVILHEKHRKPKIWRNH